MRFAVDDCSMSDSDLPRVFDRTIAAAYCGLAPAGFSSWVRAGRLPGPIPARKVEAVDIEALAEAFPG